MSDPRARRIKIAAGVLKRFVMVMWAHECCMGKERVANHKELAQQLERIEKLKAKGEDEYTIRKQVSCAVAR